ncbi:Lymphocyte expansion molecule [Dissostichus eleginoides]|uniref:Lymphocyte expansion molecule n=1 Tax=Dissostichus eleginoides TaxID=100907 RepID=A0AAD9CKQ8_DISEL|nr:Lymphocyte expansion molecule [Dissostichus eleginoides]
MPHIVSTNQRCPRGSAPVEGGHLLVRLRFPVDQSGVDSCQETSDVANQRRQGGVEPCPPIPHVTLLSSSQAVKHPTDEVSKETEKILSLRVNTAG